MFVEILTELFRNCGEFQRIAVSEFCKVVEEISSKFREIFKKILNYLKIILENRMERRVGWLLA